MKSALILILTASSCVFAQERAITMQYQTGGPAGAVAWGGPGIASGSPVKGAPYSATITSTFTQTLADGNRIAQTTSGTTARDLQGRTREDVPLPATAKMPTDAPHLAFIEDPVSHTSYALNLTDKTAQKISMPSPSDLAGGSGAADEPRTVFVQGAEIATMSGSLPPPAFTVRNGASVNEQVTTETLGSQTMEGILVNGVRTIRTIPAAQIGNAQPIKIVSEVWTSPELKIVVYSKRSDPLTGEQTFQRSNIVRSEPDPSLFAVPSDFQIRDSPEPITVRANE